MKFTHFDNEIEHAHEPTFSIDWVDALLIGGFVLFFAGVLFNIIH